MFLEIKGKSIIELEINGCIVSVAIRPADTLLYVLREQLGLVVCLFHLPCLHKLV